MPFQLRFWVGMLFAFLIAFKLYLVSDLSFIHQYGAADAALYVERADALLAGQALGAYYSMLLYKLPGISFLIASVRYVGIPYFLFQSLFFIGACISIFLSLKYLKIKLLPRLLVFALLLFHPFTYSELWIAVYREAIELSLVGYLLSFLIVIVALARVHKKSWTAMAGFAITFGLCISLREDGSLYWLLLASMAAVLFAFYGKKSISPVLWTCLLSIVVTFSLDRLQRSFIERHYGLPIIHDMGEGELPKLVATLRSIHKQSTNRHIHVEYGNLKLLAAHIPEFAKVVKWFELNQLPGHAHEGCINFGICDEVTAVSFFEAIRKSLAYASQAKTLTQSQAFYRRMRSEIENLCDNGTLQCSNDGPGILPLPRVYWASVYLNEWIYNWRRVLLSYLPKPAYLPQRFNVDAETSRIWQRTLMTSYSDPLSSLEQERDTKWTPYSKNLRSHLEYLLDNPNIAAETKPTQLGPSTNGQKQIEPSHYSLVSIRAFLARFINIFAQCILIFGLFAGVASVFFIKSKNNTSAVLFTTLIVFAFLRISALSYVGVFLGVPDRLLYTTGFSFLILSACVSIQMAGRFYLLAKKAFSKNPASAESIRTYT